MIIYATKQTVDRYGIKMPEDFQDPIIQQIALNVYNYEKGKRLLEWGAKLFYFDRRKCIQICNFASKLTIVLVDIKKLDLEVIGDYIARYLLEIYSNDKIMTDLLQRFFEDHPFICFAKLTDRSIIATMNNFQSICLVDGYRLYDFIDNGTLKTIKLNKKINKNHLISDKTNGKKQYYYPADKFAELLKDYYK